MDTDSMQSAQLWVGVLEYRSNCSLQPPIESRVHQQQERSLIFCGSKDKESHLHLGPRWRHHSITRKYDNDLRNQTGLESTFHVEDRERIHWFLGLRIRQEEGKVTVDQERCTKKLLSGSIESMQTLKNSSQFDFETSDSAEWRQRSGLEDLDMRGWIISVSVQTDEASHLVHSQHSVRTHGWNQLWLCRKRLLWNLLGSKVLKLTYTKEAKFDLVGESDADWSGYENDRKSTTGYFFKLNVHCAALSWVVKKQSTFLTFHQKQKIGLW